MYTDEEIQAAVEGLVTARIRRPIQDSVRQVEVQLSDVQQAVATLLLTKPSSIYRLLKLGAIDLADRCSQFLQQVEEIEELMDAAGRRAVPIQDISPLKDAENALLAMENALNSRTATSSLPAQVRFEAAVQSMLGKYGSNVKWRSSLVQAPQDAKSRLSTQITQMRTLWAQSWSRKVLLEGALDEWNSLGVPVAAQLSVVSKARELIGSDYDELEGLGDLDRSAKAREKLLNLVSAAQAVTSVFEGGALAREYETNGGTIGVYADEDKEAERAEVVSEVDGPYPLISYDVDFGQEADERNNNRVEFQTEQGSGYVDLPRSYVCELIGSGVSEKYVFYDGQVADNNGYVWPKNNKVYVREYVDGQGYDRTVSLNTVVGFDGNNVPFPYDSSGGVYSLEEMVVAFNAFLIDSVTPPPGSPPPPSSPPPSNPPSKIEAFVTDNGSLGLRGVDAQACVVDEVVGVEVRHEGLDGSGALAPLGLAPDFVTLSRRVSAVEVASSVVGSTSLVGAEAVPRPYNEMVIEGLSWTNPGNQTEIVVALFTGPCTITVDSLTQVTLVSDWADVDFVELGVSVGDEVHLPTQYVLIGGQLEPLGDRGSVFTIDSLSSSSITASRVATSPRLREGSSTIGSGGDPVEIGGSVAGRTVDIGLASVASSVLKFHLIQVHEVNSQGQSSGNAGVYEIQEVDSYSKFRVRLDFALSTISEERSQRPLELSTTIGPGVVSLYSEGLGTDATITAQSDLLFPVAKYATMRTSYLVVPTSMEIGDLVRIFSGPGAYTDLEVIWVEEIDGQVVVTVDGTLSEDVPIGGFSYPQASLIVGANVVATTFSEQLSSVPTLPSNYFVNLGALVSPLLLSSVPSGRVATAKAELQVVKEQVQQMKDVLDAVTAPDVPEVDDLIATYREKGSDRAIDILLQGRYADFFNLDLDTVSYAGNMMKRARDVSRQDLPVSKYSSSRLRRRILADFVDSDLDYDFTDGSEDVPPPDIPWGLDTTSKPD